MSKVLPFPGATVRKTLLTLQNPTCTPDDEVEAALVLVGILKDGEPYCYLSKALSVLHRHRTHYRALALAEKLSMTGHREVRRLGLALVDLDAIEDVEVGFTLLGG